MRDYQQILIEIQGHLARQYLKEPDILNEPGRSPAMKIDPFYYLVLHPEFLDSLTRWSGFSPGLIEDTLVRTGNLVRLAGNDSPFITLGVRWEQGLEIRVKAGFVLADFIENSLKIYARVNRILPVSGLVILEQEQEALHALFQGKTRLNRIAFG